MTYLKKAHRDLLHNINDIINVRKDTLSNIESDTYLSFQEFLRDVDEENEKLRAKAADNMKEYRADPKKKKKFKQQNHEQYMKRKALVKQQAEEKQG